jgi:hypothetical protein
VPRARAGAVALLGCLATTACGLGRSADDTARARQLAERDELRREIDGYRDLLALERTGLFADDRELLLRVDGALLRSLIGAALPVVVEGPRHASVWIDSVALALRGNVARVVLTGLVARTRVPRAAAALTLTGALEDFAVGADRQLRARIAIDGTELGAPTGVPAGLGPVAVRLLQEVVDRTLPQLTDALPAIALPVHVERDLQLPGFGPEGALSVEPATAPLALSVSRFLAFGDALLVVLRLERRPFVRAPRDAADPMAPAASGAAAGAPGATPAAPVTAGDARRGARAP